MNKKTICFCSSILDNDSLGSILLEFGTSLSNAHVITSSNPTNIADIDIFVFLISSNFLKDEICLSVLNNSADYNKQITLIKLEEGIKLSALPKNINKRIHTTLHDWNKVDEKEKAIVNLLSWVGCDLPLCNATGTEVEIDVKAKDGFVYQIKNWSGCFPSNETMRIRLWPGTYKIQLFYRLFSSCTVIEPLVVQDERLYISVDLDKILDEQGYSGKLIYENGDIYVGDIKNGKPNGTGHLETSSGQKQEGLFEDGLLISGKIELSRGGTLFIGKGESKCVTTSGDEYIGNIVDGKIESGILKYSNQDIYEGSFHDWKRHGEGKMKFHFGASYEGLWEDDQPSGRGKYTWVNGFSFEGVFHNGKPEGTIRIFDRNGNLLQVGEADELIGIWV